MSEHERRLKSLEPLARQYSSARSYSQVKAAEERLNGGVPLVERLRARLELIEGGLSASEAMERTPEPDYPGREADCELVRRYYAQWYPEGYDAKAELVKKLDTMRQRRAASADFKFSEVEHDER